MLWDKFLKKQISLRIPKQKETIQDKYISPKNKSNGKGNQQTDIRCCS